MYEKESEEETNENIDNKKKAKNVVVEVEKTVVKVKDAALFAAKVMFATESNEDSLVQVGIDDWQGSH